MKDVVLLHMHRNCDRVLISFLGGFSRIQWLENLLTLRKNFDGCLKKYVVTSKQF